MTGAVPTRAAVPPIEDGKPASGRGLSAVLPEDREEFPSPKLTMPAALVAAPVEAAVTVAVTASKPMTVWTAVGHRAPVPPTSSGGTWRRYR